MHADEVNKEALKPSQDQKKGDSEDRDDISTPNKKASKRRERGGQRDRRKKQNAARFPKKQSPDDRIAKITEDNKSKDEVGNKTEIVTQKEVQKIKIKQRERQSSTNEQQQQMQRPRQVTNNMRRELLHFELQRLRESESRTPIKPKTSKMARRKERKKRAKQSRNNPSKVTAYSNPNISKDDEFIFVHLAGFSSKNNRQFIPSVLKDLEKYKTVSAVYAEHDFRTHHIIFDEESQTYFCQICLMSFPNKENALHHCYRDSYHKNLKSKVFELENARLAGSRFSLDDNPDRLAMLNAELQSILDKRQNSIDFHKRTECFERIAAILKKFQPDIKVQLYGSTAYEAVLETSDINICVSNEGTRANTLLSQIFYFLKDLTNDPDAKLRAVRDNFYASGASSSVGFTPHVAAFDQETGIKLTIIGADHDRTSRIKTANLIKFYLTYEPKIQRLALIFRQWAHWCGLDEPDNGTLPAFNLVLCVICFFQKKGWVPFLHEKTDCNLMIIPYRLENGKCFIRRLKSSTGIRASINETSASKSINEEEINEIKIYEQPNTQEKTTKAYSLASSDDEEDSCELIFEDDTIDSTSEPHTIEQDTVTLEIETMESKTDDQITVDEEELEDEESLLEGSCVPKDMCLAKLLVELFNFIAYEINYEKEFISIRERNLTRGSLNLGVKRIAIQDPFIPTKNAARTMSSPANFEFWKAKLRVTYGRLFIGPNELRKMIHANKFEHIKPGIERIEVLRENDNKLVEVKSDAGLEVFVEDGETELTDKINKLNIEDKNERKRGSVKLNARLLNHINNYIAADKSRTPSPKTSPRDSTPSPILTSEKKNESLASIASAEDDLETPRPSEESTLEETKATSDEDDDSASSNGDDDSNSELDYEPSEVIASVCSKVSNDPIFKRMTAVFDRECVATGPLPKRMCALCRSENCAGDNCPDDIERVRLEELPEMKTTDYAWLDGVLMKLYRRKKPSEKEINQRERALKFIQNFMEMNFDKNSRLELFGSSRNGFGFSGSDLDICLTFAGHDNEPPEIYSDAVDVIKGVANAFKSNSIFSNIVAITQAKVPIVKFDLHLDTSVKFEADISFYNVLAKRNTKLLRTYCLLDSRCEVLGYLVKAMVKEVGIGDASRGSLSSYAYTLMMIHFLQNEGVLPVLQELHDGEERPEYMVEGFNTWFQEDPIRIAAFINNRTDAQTNDCLSKLWVKFLRYYTEDFNFERDVVQCQQSGRLSLFEKEWTSKCISIEDPFDYNHNLGAGVSRKMANYIISVFRRARQVFGSFDISIYNKPPAAPEVNVDVFCDILISKALLTNGEEVPSDRCCRICGKIGHFIKDCPLSSRNRRLAEKNGNIVETPPRPCFVCNQVGHLKKDCPNKDLRRQQRNYKNYDRLQNAPKLDLDSQNQKHDSRFRRYNQEAQTRGSPGDRAEYMRTARPNSGQPQFRPSPLAHQSGVMLQHNLAQLKFEHGNDLNSTVNRLNRADAQYYQNVRNTMAIHQSMQARQRAESELQHQQHSGGQHAIPERPRTYTG